MKAAEPIEWSMLALERSVHPSAPTSNLLTLANRIASVWAPALGADRAFEAANNTVTPLGDCNHPPVVIIAARVLEHRVRAFGWRLDQRTIDFLALQAARVWIAHQMAHAAAKTSAELDEHGTHPRARAPLSELEVATMRAATIGARSSAHPDARSMKRAMRIAADTMRLKREAAEYDEQQREEQERAYDLHLRDAQRGER